MALNNDNQTLIFSIPGALYFVAFSMFDIKLILNIWKNQNINTIQQENNIVIRKKLFRFYIVFCKIY